MVPPALSVSSGVSTSPTAFATLTARALHQLPPSPPHPTPPPLLAAGRAFLEAMREHPGLAARCRAKRIVMMVSNRFDWGLAGKRDYYSAVQASIDNATNFVWAVNNPFEQVGVKVVCGVGEQVWHLFCSTHRARLVSLGVGSPPPPPLAPPPYPPTTPTCAPAALHGTPGHPAARPPAAAAPPGQPAQLLCVWRRRRPP